VVQFEAFRSSKRYAAAKLEPPGRRERFGQIKTGERRDSNPPRTRCICIDCAFGLTTGSMASRTNVGILESTEALSWVSGGSSYTTHKSICHASRARKETVSMPTRRCGHLRTLLRLYTVRMKKNRSQTPNDTVGDFAYHGERKREVKSCDIKALRSSC
jgi:hypothetical protein